MSQTEEQIIVSGSLLSLTVFQEKLMRNFYIINSRLKKLESFNDIELKMRTVQKQLRFLTTKVESMVDKIPKDGIAVSKKEVIIMCKDQLFDMLNNSQEKIKESQTFKQLIAEIQQLKGQLKTKNNQNQGLRQSLTKQNSFTAGSMFLSENKKNAQASQQLLGEVLSKEENRIVNQIMSSDAQYNQFEKVKKDIEDLYDSIDNLKIMMGKRSFVEKEVYEYDKYQRESPTQQKSIKKGKSKKKLSPQGESQQLQKFSLNLSQKIPEPIRGQVPMQIERHQSKTRMESNINGKSEIIMKQDLIARKTFNHNHQFNQQIKSPNTLLNKGQLSGVFINDSGPERNTFAVTTQSHFNKRGQFNKVEYFPQNKLLQKAQRSKSLKKLERVEQKLRVDDIKQINTVLKEIQTRLEGKTNQDFFSEFIREIEEKLQILRITKDSTNQINDLRKMVYNLDNKLQSIIAYLQAITNEDDALIVKKNWTCISCDKMVEKFSGKVGQHLNWDSVQPKKISPSKVGAFGQTGQLASKIKILLEGAE